jgi:hypothetical protein
MQQSDLTPKRKDAQKGFGEEPKIGRAEAGKGGNVLVGKYTHTKPQSSPSVNKT